MKRVSFICIVFLVLLALIPSVSVFAGVSPVDAVSWTRVNIPAEGIAGNWALSRSAGIKYLTQSIDGTLYCYTAPIGTTNTLFKSIDSGISWSYVDGVSSGIIDIAAAPDVANVIFYATISMVYESIDAGASFTLLPPGPGGAGAGNISITAIDITRYSGHYVIAVSTKDADAGQFGGVYLYDESNPGAGWQNTGIGGYDVYDVAFSRNSSGATWNIAAAGNDEINTHILTNINFSGWNNTIGDAVIPINVLVSAFIAFPDDYGTSAGSFNLYVGFNAGGNNGDVYAITGVNSPAASTFVDLNAGAISGFANVNVCSMVVSGPAASAKIFAGSSSGAQVYSSIDSGLHWSAAVKPPTGASDTFVVNGLTGSPDQGKLFTATGGAECAFSVSTDGGNSFNQLSLINTQISSIVDFAASPVYGIDNTMFLLTFGSTKHSLWLSENGGVRWKRVFSSSFSGIGSLDSIRLSPQYGSSKVVYVSGTFGLNSAVWKSVDNGQIFSSPQVSCDPDSGAPFTINQLIVVNDSTLIAGSYNGTNGLIYRTFNGGLTYSHKAVLGNSAIYSVAISPDFVHDNTVLAGNRNGWIFRSSDACVSFSALPSDAVTAPLSGNVTVAFDCDFSHDSVVFAASDTSGKGISRFTIGKSSRWESIDSTMPASSLINQLNLSPAGILYAANSKAGAGIERCISSTSVSAAFETVTCNLDATARLNGLWTSGNRLWSMDTANVRLMTFLDTLSSPVALSSPFSYAGGIETKNVTVSWESLAGAASYKWQVDTDADFSEIPSGFEGTTSTTSTHLPSLDPGTMYYWRVQVVSPVSSIWSPNRSFTTVLSGSVTAPDLSSPGSLEVLCL